MTPDALPAADDDNKLMAERRDKLAAIRAQGIAFPNDFKPRQHAADLQHKYGEMPNEELEPLGVTVALAGRMMLKRVCHAGQTGNCRQGAGR